MSRHSTSGTGGLPTIRDMERRGASDGRTTRARLGLFVREDVEPSPGVDNPRVPVPVRECENQCAEEAAKLQEASREQTVTLERQISRDEALIKDLQPRDLPKREWRLNGLIHLLVLVGIACSEFAVNSVAFAVFGGTDLVTYMIALIVAVGLPLCAWVVGTAWKQRRHEAAAVLALALALGLIISIALIRQSYFYDVVNALLHLNLAPWLLTVIYVVINAVMFGISVLASYLHAERDPEGQRDRRRLEEAKDRLTGNRKTLAGLGDRCQARIAALTPMLQALAYAYNRGNMRTRRRSKVAAHREQPVWVDRVPSLAVAVPALPRGVAARAPVGVGGNGNGGRTRQVSVQDDLSDFVPGFDMTEGN